MGSRSKVENFKLFYGCIVAKLNILIYSIYAPNNNLIKSNIHTNFKPRLKHLIKFYVVQSYTLFTLLTI